MRELSLHERIRNADASQQVEKVKARHAYYHGMTATVEEYGNIWTQREDVSWAHGFGRMRGYEMISRGLVGTYDQMAMENMTQLWQVYPEVTGRDPRPLFECSVHTLVTDVVEVAADGQSARASFITPGVIHCRLNADVGEDGKPCAAPKYCHILWERYGADFILENGTWKYLHEQVCPDLMGHIDCTNWAQDDWKRLTATDEEPAGALGTMTMPMVADPGPLHAPYSVLQKPLNTCPWPEPYETLDENNTYTPPKKG